MKARAIFRRRDELLAVLSRFFIARVCGAALRFVAPTIVIFAHSAHADFDLNLSASTRSYPLSGVLEAESGYGAKIWGDLSGPYYGYARVKADMASAVTYNSLQGSAEFFPIAFLGLRAGGEAIQSDAKYSAYDCELYLCVGRFYRTFAEAELSLGAGRVFVQGRARRERWTLKDTRAQDFIDPTSGLRLNPEGDSETVYHAIIGVKASEAWSILGVVRYAESDAYKGQSRFPSLIFRLKRGDWTFGFGAGVFESELKQKSFSTLGFLRWEIAPSLALD